MGVSVRTSMLTRVGLVPKMMDACCGVVKRDRHMTTVRLWVRECELKKLTTQFCPQTAKTLGMKLCLVVCEPLSVKNVTHECERCPPVLRDV